MSSRISRWCKPVCLPLLIISSLYTANKRRLALMKYFQLIINPYHAASINSLFLRSPHTSRESVELIRKLFFLMKISRIIDERTQELSGRSGDICEEGPRESRLSEKREEILKACHCHTGFAPFVGTFDLFFIISLWNLFFHTPIRFSLFLARSYVCSLAYPLNKYWCVLCVLHKLLSGFINLFKRAYMLRSIQKVGRGRKGERKWFCSFGKMISGYMIIFQLHRYRQVQHYIIVGNLICSFFLLLWNWASFIPIIGFSALDSVDFAYKTKVHHIFSLLGKYTKFNLVEHDTRDEISHCRHGEGEREIISRKSKTYVYILLAN